MFGGRVGKAPWRLTVSRPHLRRAVGTGPGLDTLAGARYSTTETTSELKLRWSSREGALAPDRIETSPAQGGGHVTGSRYARWRSLLDHREDVGAEAFGGRV